MQAIAAAAEPAELELQRKITGAAGERIDQLEGFAAGDAAAEFAVAIGKSEQATAATRAAQAALPAAEKDVADAIADIERLETVKREKANAVLLAYGNEIAARYRAKFEELGELGDQLTSLCRAVALGGHTGDLVLAHEPFDVPRFSFPAHRCSETYTLAT